MQKKKRKHFLLGINRCQKEGEEVGGLGGCLPSYDSYYEVHSWVVQTMATAYTCQYTCSVHCTVYSVQYTQHTAAGSPFRQPYLASQLGNLILFKLNFLAIIGNQFSSLFDHILWQMMITISCYNDSQITKILHVIR